MPLYAITNAPQLQPPPPPHAADENDPAQPAEPFTHANVAVVQLIVTFHKTSNITHQPPAPHVPHGAQPPQYPPHPPPPPAPPHHGCINSRFLIAPHIHVTTTCCDHFIPPIAPAEELDPATQSVKNPHPPPPQAHGLPFDGIDPAPPRPHVGTVFFIDITDHVGEDPV